jgi:thiol-disulfide isomerase/thioredoxin
VSFAIPQVDVLGRFLLAVAIVGGGLGLYGLFNRVSLVRARKKTLGLERTKSGVPVLLYFTTPYCAPCKTIQRPAIQQLKERFGEQVQVVEIDASEHPDVASHWGVFSVPTTFIIDAVGNPRHVNHGVATVDKLFKQFVDIN